MTTTVHDRHVISQVLAQDERTEDYFDVDDKL